MAKRTYRAAGVDIDAGNALVEAIKPLARATARPGVLGGLGGFGGVREGPWLDTKRRLLDHERRWAGRDGAPGATP